MKFRNNLAALIVALLALVTWRTWHADPKTTRVEDHPPEGNPSEINTTHNTRQPIQRNRHRQESAPHTKKTEADFLRQIKHIEAGDGVDFVTQVIDCFGHDSEKSKTIIRSFFSANSARLPPHEIVDAYEAIGDEALQNQMPGAAAEAFLKEGVDLEQAIEIGSLMPYKRIGHCSLFMQNLFMHRILSDLSISSMVEYLPELREGEQRDGALRGLSAAIHNDLIGRVDNPNGVIKSIQSMGLNPSELKKVMTEINSKSQGDD